MRSRAPVCVSRCVPHTQVPLLGENAFLVTKGFAAMKEAIARKVQAVLDRLEAGTLTVRRADEL